MKYRLQCYTDILGRVVLCYWYMLLSASSAFMVLFTGIFATRVLQYFSVNQHIIDAIFLPCAIFVLWSFCMSAIEMSMDKNRDTL
jgi:hypothetical protein